MLLILVKMAEFNIHVVSALTKLILMGKKKITKYVLNFVIQVFRALC